MIQLVIEKAENIWYNKPVNSHRYGWTTENRRIK